MSKVADSAPIGIDEETNIPVALMDLSTVLQLLFFTVAVTGLANASGAVSEARMKVALAEGKAAASAPAARGKSVEVTLKGAGSDVEYSVAGKRRTLAEAVAQIRAAKPGELLLRVDRDVPWDKVFPLIDLANTERIGIAVSYEPKTNREG